MKKRGWEFTIDLTFLEIYNETIQVRLHIVDTYQTIVRERFHTTFTRPFSKIDCILLRH